MLEYFKEMLTEDETKPAIFAPAGPVVCPGTERKFCIFAPVANTKAGRVWNKFRMFLPLKIP